MKIVSVMMKVLVMVSVVMYFQWFLYSKEKAEKRLICSNTCVLSFQTITNYLNAKINL